MNLSYTLPKAEENILAGVKLHTLRKDPKNRWKPGLTIHHCYSFRSKKGYFCFLKNECKGKQQVLLLLDENSVLHVVVDRRPLKFLEIMQFIKNDGFAGLSDFINWFFPEDPKGNRKKTIWAGKLIHWTDLKY